MSYSVYRRDGTKVQSGDTVVSFRGQDWIFSGAYHPRKVSVYWMTDPNGPKDYPNRTSREYYASVFDLQIVDDETGEVTFNFEKDA